MCDKQLAGRRTGDIHFGRYRNGQAKKRMLGGIRHPLSQRQHVVCVVVFSRIHVRQGIVRQSILVGRPSLFLQQATHPQRAPRQGIL